jgi:hemolysin III
MRIVSFSVYGLTSIPLYLFSTLYHSLRGRTKRVFQVLDNHAIYLLIANTYTPFCLVALVPRFSVYCKSSKCQVSLGVT